MKKRSFTRYDTHIDAYYCLDKENREWKSCLINKISRKGIGFFFPAGQRPLEGSLLHFKLLTGAEADYVNLRGVVKWTKSCGAGHTGGIELSELVEEVHWLKLIYCIRQPSAEKQVIDLRTMSENTLVKKCVHPPPAKVIVPTKLDYIKNILNYKIL